MNSTRRCFLKFCGGAAVGALISPAPWKLLDDVSIWTQNWSWTARPPRGPVGAAITTCTLCPTGCGMRLRTIGEHIVSARGVAGHPRGTGALCPVGTGFAQLKYHPLRVVSAVRRDAATGGWTGVDADALTAEIGRRARPRLEPAENPRVAVLDPRPGRALSGLYREFCAALGARYLTLPDNRELSEAALAGWLDLGPLRPGLDPARAGAVISFGSPVFDDWRETETARTGRGPEPAEGSRPVTIQIEPNLSRTAARADLWLPIRPGTEAAAGLGLAHLLRGRTGGARSSLRRYGEAGRRFEQLADAHTPQRVARRTGLEPALLVDAARRIAEHGPAVFVGGGNPGAGPLGEAEEFVVWGLNLMLGGPGARGGFRLRTGTAALFDEPGCQPVETMAEVPDGSLDLLLVDGAFPSVPVPGGLLRRKMNDGGRIVGLSAFAGGLCARCDELLPTAAPGEFADDVPSRALAPRATWAIAASVSDAPAGAAHPADRLAAIAAAAGLSEPSRFGRDAHAERLRSRALKLVERGRGEVFDPRTGCTQAVTAFSSPRQLDETLRHGGCWSETSTVDERPAAATPLGAGLAAALDRIAADAGATAPADDRFSWTLVIASQAGVAVGAVLPPVLGKLYRESNLLPGADVVRVNPASARPSGLPDGGAVRLLTSRGEAVMRAVHDESVMPGVAVVAPGPSSADLGDPDGTDIDILELCDAYAAPVWRVGRASLRRA